MATRSNFSNRLWKNHLKTAWFVIVVAALLGFARASSAQADLSIITNSWPDPVTQGTNLLDTCTCTYSFTISNAGPSMATGVVVSNQFPYWVSVFFSATGGSTPTNGSLLMHLGSLAVGATSSVQVVVQCYMDSPDTNGLQQSRFTNVFQVYADQPDPDPANNTATTEFGIARTTVYSTSTFTMETNLASSVNQQATNYTTELIARMPSGTVLFDQSFNTSFSDPSVQAGVTQAAGVLTTAGATSFTGPTETSASQSLVGSSTVTVTNVIGTDVSAATSLYIGPQTIMVGPDRSVPLFILAGQMDFDTLITTVVTNLVTTTNTSTYLDAAVCTMTAIVPQPELGLPAVRSNQFGFIVNGASNLAIVVEACTNLASPSWTSLEIFRLTNGPIYFSDPAWERYPMRFYRTRLP